MCVTSCIKENVIKLGVEGFQAQTSFKVMKYITI